MGRSPWTSGQESHSDRWFLALFAAALILALLGAANWLVTERAPHAAVVLAEAAPEGRRPDPVPSRSLPSRPAAHEAVGAAPSRPPPVVQPPPVLAPPAAPAPSEEPLFVPAETPPGEPEAAPAAEDDPFEAPEWNDHHHDAARDDDILPR